MLDLNCFLVFPVITDWYSRYDIHTAFVSPTFGLETVFASETEELSDDELFELSLDCCSDEDDSELFDDETDDGSGVCASEDFEVSFDVVSDVSSEDNELSLIKLLVWGSLSSDWLIITMLLSLLLSVSRFALSSIIFCSTFASQAVIETIINAESAKARSRLKVYPPIPSNFELCRL